MMHTSGNCLMALYLSYLRIPTPGWMERQSNVREVAAVIRKKVPEQASNASKSATLQTWQQIHHKPLFRCLRLTGISPSTKNTNHIFLVYIFVWEVLSGHTPLSWLAFSGEPLLLSKRWPWSMSPALPVISTQSWPPRFRNFRWETLEHCMGQCIEIR